MKHVFRSGTTVAALLLALLVSPPVSRAETQKAKPTVLRYTLFKTYAYVSTDFRPGTVWAIDYKEPLREAEVRPYSRRVECRR